MLYVGVFCNFLHPCPLNRLEGLPPCDIVCKNDPLQQACGVEKCNPGPFHSKRPSSQTPHMSSTVVAAGERSEALLPGCIPDRQLDARSIHIHDFHAEVHPNCWRNIFKPARGSMCEISLAPLTAATDRHYPRKAYLSCVKRISRADLPTPVSPTNRILKTAQKSTDYVYP